MHSYLFPELGCFFPYEERSFLFTARKFQDYAGSKFNQYMMKNLFEVIKIKPISSEIRITNLRSMKMLLNFELV